MVWSVLTMNTYNKIVKQAFGGMITQDVKQEIQMALVRVNSPPWNLSLNPLLNSTHTSPQPFGQKAELGPWDLNLVLHLPHPNL